VDQKVLILNTVHVTQKQPHFDVLMFTNSSTEC